MAVADQRTPARWLRVSLLLLSRDARIHNDGARAAIPPNPSAPMIPSKVSLWHQMPTPPSGYECWRTRSVRPST